MNKREVLPKGFFTKNGEPTIRALTAYLVYYNNGGNVYDQEIKSEGLQAVKDYFKKPGGYEAMLKWGLYDSCLRTKTSYAQARAMRNAASTAWNLKYAFKI